MSPKMTSKERMLAVLGLEEPDILPVAPYLNYHYAPRATGYTMSEYILGTNKFRAEVLLEQQKKFGIDWILGDSGHPHGWRESVDITKEKDRYIITQKNKGYYLGRWHATSILPEDSEPYYINRTKGYLSRIEDYEELPITDADTILNGGQLELLEIISKRVSEEVLVAGHISAPFVSGSGTVGLQQWIIDLHKKPDIVKKVMERAVEQEVERARAEIDAGAELFFITECYAGVDILSPKLYEEYAFPYERILIKKLNKMGIPTSLQFCGDPMLILDKIIETGATAYHFEESKKGFTVDIYKIREKLRDKACMFIPFDAISLLQSGDLKAIEREVNNIVSSTAKGGGVVLSTGCPVMNDIPEESIETMIKTARRTGRYPISH
jgi:uroporphyrinogen decarboxylase